MKIDSVGKTNFKSKAYPVAPSIIKTQKGRLHVAEVRLKDLKNDAFFEKLAKFFLKNFASVTGDPNWNHIKNMSSGRYEEAVREYSQYYKAKVNCKNDDMTLLLVKDKRKKIKGACLSYGYDRIPGAENTACYIDSIAVDSLYRGFKIGKIMLEKTLESAKNKYTDAFLVGDTNVIGFYKKLGFEPLNENNENQKKVIDYLSRRRSDYPRYVEFLTKDLQNSKEHWYDNLTVNE